MDTRSGGIIYSGQGPQLLFWPVGVFWQIAGLRAPALTHLHFGVTMTDRNSKARGRLGVAPLERLNAMEVKLIVLGGKRAGREIPVPGPEFVIGRADGCQLRPGSDRVSRRHAVIRIKAGSVTIEDCGSKNGTLVNDKQTEGEQRLKTGDRLTIGPLEFEVQLAVNVGGKKKPKVKNVQEAVSRTVEASTDDMDISAWLEGDDGTDSGFRPQIVFRTKDKDDEYKDKKKAKADANDSTKPDTQDSREAATKMLRKFFDPNQ